MTASAEKRYSLTVDRSTRLSILEHALADVIERLAEVPPNRDVEKLRALASQYETEVSRWEEHPPEESKRAALLKSVLDLNVAVIRAGARASSSDMGTAGEPDDEDFPKPI